MIVGLKCGARSNGIWLADLSFAFWDPFMTVVVNETSGL